MVRGVPRTVRLPAFGAFFNGVVSFTFVSLFVSLFVYLTGQRGLSVAQAGVLSGIGGAGTLLYAAYAARILPALGTAHSRPVHRPDAPTPGRPGALERTAGEARRTGAPRRDRLRRWPACAVLAGCAGAAVLAARRLREPARPHRATGGDTPHTEPATPGTPEMPEKTETL